MFNNIPNKVNRIGNLSAVYSTTMPVCGLSMSNCVFMLNRLQDSSASLAASLP